MVNLEINWGINSDSSQKYEFELDLTENDTLNEVIVLFHKVSQLPSYRELKLKDSVHRIAFDYFFKDNKTNDFIFIENFNILIKDIEGYLSDKKVTIYIDIMDGMVN